MFRLTYEVPPPQLRKYDLIREEVRDILMGHFLDIKEVFDIENNDLILLHENRDLAISFVNVFMDGILKVKELANIDKSRFAGKECTLSGTVHLISDGAFGFWSMPRILFFTDNIGVSVFFRWPFGPDNRIL